MYCVYECHLNPLHWLVGMAEIYKEGIHPVTRDGAKMLECYQRALGLSSLRKQLRGEIYLGT